MKKPGSQNRKKSQTTILMAFALLVLAGAMATGISAVLKTGIEALSYQRDGMIAFYIADAGVERMLTEITVQNSTVILPINETIGEGYYNVTVTIDTPPGPPGSRVRVESTGRCRDSERQIKRTITSSAGGPPYGWAYGLHKRDSNSWQEQ